MSKLIIIEGTDNSGKDTLIKNLFEYFETKDYDIVMKHFEKPISKTFKECSIEQDNSFILFVKNIVEKFKIKDNEIFICNRAFHGEYVYGTLYRERQTTDVLDMICNCEDILLENNIDVTYVQLFGEPNFLSKNDDGKSLSEGKVELIKKEGELFKEVFKLSKLDKKVFIEVNKNGKFIDKFEILNRVLNTIEK